MLSVRFTADELAWLQREAEASGVPVTRLVRERALGGFSYDNKPKPDEPVKMTEPETTRETVTELAMKEPLTMQEVTAAAQTVVRDPALESLLASGVLQVGTDNLDPPDDPPRQVVYEEITRWKLNPMREALQTDGEYTLPIWKDERGKYMDDEGKEIPHKVAMLIEVHVSKGRMRWETE